MRDDRTHPLRSPGGPGAARSVGPLFTSVLHDGVHVVEFSRPDVLDARYIQELGDDLYRHLKDSERPLVVVDLTRVRLMSSTAIGMLIALRKFVQRQKGDICLTNVGEELLQVFKITKLNKILKIHDDTTAAAASLRR